MRRPDRASFGDKGQGRVEHEHLTTVMEPSSEQAAPKAKDLATSSQISTQSAASRDSRHSHARSYTSSELSEAPLMRHVVSLRRRMRVQLDAGQNANMLDLHQCALMLPLGMQVPALHWP